MRCPNCDKEVEKSHEFCVHCGFSLKSRAKTVFSGDLSILTVGRGEHNDIILDYPQISWDHARLFQKNGQWFIEDLGSTNHTYINDRSRPVKRARVRPEDTLYFGSYKISASRLLASGKNTALGRSMPRPITIAKKTTVFGRDPECDFHLDYPQISWRHAKLTRKGGELILEDLNSTNGTYVNGKKIKRHAVAKDDVISFSSFSFTFTEDMKIVERDYRGDIRLDAEQITVVVPDKKTGEPLKLLDDISLSVYPSELVGLMGPSGAGKTTLLLALNGYSKPREGCSLVNKEPLCDNYDKYRGVIGYVPQDDIIHPELTVYEALYYTAKLRLPSDTSEEEIRQRIESVLAQLDLSGPDGKKDIRDRKIGSPESKEISGGQRKKVNLAMELITDPQLLFLDEPTSGLSSQDTLVVMEVLRKLADRGKTIILTIHQPSLEAYRQMDNVIVLDFGKLVYYGPAFPDSIEFFNPGKSDEKLFDSADNALKGLKTGSDMGVDWQARYAGSVHCQKYVRQRRTDECIAKASPQDSKPARGGTSRQFLTLASRYLKIKSSDRNNTAILLLQAPIIALLIAMVFDIEGEPPFTPLFLLVISAFWFGASNSAGEIVKEKAIYLRERMVNLNIPSYVLSKFFVLGLLCLAQCLVLSAIVYTFLDISGGFFPILGAVFLAAVAGLSIGLFISSVAPTRQTATSIVPLVLIPMIILGGGILPVKRMNDASFLCATCTPSRWSYEHIVNIANDERPVGAADYMESLFGERQTDGGAPLFAMLLIVAVSTGATMLVLKRRDSTRY